MRSKNKTNSQSIRYAAIILIVVSFTCSAFFIVQAWVEPDAYPPGGNIAAPLHTGTVSQVKKGSLTVGGAGGSFGLYAQGPSQGVWGANTSTGSGGFLGIDNYGMLGFGDQFGVAGYTTAVDGTSVIGYNFFAAGTGYGVMGWTTGSATAVGGVAGYGIGGYFESYRGPALVTGTGNVGIGTASPTQKLDVNGVINATSLKINGVDVGSSFWNAATGGISYTAGNVGIGTTSPGYKLEVAGSTRVDNPAGNPGPDALYAFQNSNVGRAGQFAILNSSNPAAVLEANNLGTGPLLDLKKNGGTKVRVANDGNVGIGTESPVVGLHVAKDGISLGGNLVYNMAVTPASASSALLIGYDTTGGAFISSSAISGNNNFISFGTRNYSGNFGERMRLTQSGNVGIGTTSPGYKLEVAGSTRVDNPAGNPGPDALYAFQNSNVGRAGQFAILNSSNPAAVLEANNLGTGPLLDLKKNGGTKVRVANDGNVGIGTESPGYKLDVVGVINATGLKINGVDVTGSFTDTLQAVTNRGWSTSQPLYTSNYMQTPILYDANNSGYYVDPNGSSRLNQLYYVDSAYIVDLRPQYMYDWNDSNYYIDMNSGSRLNYLGRNYGWNWTEYDWNDSNYYMDLNNVSILNDLRVNILYDRQNTGYYVDPNSTSRLNYGVFDNVYSYGWMQSPIFYDANNTGYYVDPNSTSRLNYGLFDNVYSYGWMQSPIFYDANDSNYYLDPNGNSRLNGLYPNNITNYGSIYSAGDICTSAGGYKCLSSQPAGSGYCGAYTQGGSCWSGETSYSYNIYYLCFNGSWVKTGVGGFGAYCGVY